MDNDLEKQELSNDEIKKLIKKFNLSYGRLSKIHNRKRQQISDAVNTDEQPGLRKRIVKHLLKRESRLTQESLVTRKIFQ